MTVVELYRREDGSEVLVTTYHDDLFPDETSREIAVRPNGTALWSPPLTFVRREES